jgi:hypothetical protein
MWCSGVGWVSEALPIVILQWVTPRFARLTHPTLAVDYVFIGKFRRIKSRRMLSKTVFSVVSITIMSAANAAIAQPITVPDTPAYSAPAYCKKSTLNSVEFLQLIQTIIAHGDLTDIPFLEKILGTRFNSTYDVARDSSSDNQIVRLRSDDIFGNPIEVFLLIFYAKSQQQKSGFTAALRIGGRPNFIENCLHIPDSEFVSFFGGNFAGVPPPPGGLTASAAKTPNYPSKNGLQLELTFYFEKDKKIVTGISVFQLP